jgi:Holliday junction resolvase RusA-like endonuclease
MQRIDIHPKPSPRPRLGKYGTYMDPKYQQWKREFAFKWSKYNIPAIEMGKPIKMTVEFHIEAPKYLRQRKKVWDDLIDNRLWHTKRSDLDNLVKSVKDALNKVAYFDDAQVCELHAKKIWALEPKILIKLEEIVDLT